MEKSETEILSRETREMAVMLMSRYPSCRQKSALIPILHIAQAENGGWLSAALMDEVAALLVIKPVEVYEVATFYSMFHTEPVGKCVIEVCRTGPCWLNGSEELIGYLEKKLGISVGQTTTDGKFTLLEVECLAECDKAPLFMSGGVYYGEMNEEKVDEFLKSCKNNLD